MDNTNKKVFISYSWEVQKRVVELAERLMSKFVHTIHFSPDNTILFNREFKISSLAEIP